MAWKLWVSLAPVPLAVARSLASGRTLVAALRAATASPRIEALHVLVDTTPDPVRRAWLVALRRSGVGVSWSSSGLPATALELERVNDPAGGARLFAAAPARAAVGSQVARALPADTPDPRAVYVVGRAGWEAKFVIAALEERGWTVYARLYAAPGVAVAQGGAVTLDTSRVAAAIAFTSPAPRRALGFFPIASAKGVATNTGPSGARPLRAWMLALVLAALVGEWASRRLRGAP